MICNTHNTIHHRPIHTPVRIITIYTIVQTLSTSLARSPLCLIQISMNVTITPTTTVTSTPNVTTNSAAMNANVRKGSLMWINSASDDPAKRVNIKNYVPFSLGPIGPQIAPCQKLNKSSQLGIRKVRPPLRLRISCLWS